MHSSRELRSSSFEVRVDGRPARLEDVFEGFGEQDRLGVVMSRPCGAVGASALITATTTAFYDIQRARGPDFFVYPDYYLFHVGRPLGDHARLDVWPRRKEVVVGTAPQTILEAIDDRAITRLVVEDGTPAEPALDAEVVASARGRIRTCLAYSATGRVADPDVEITGSPVTEGYVEAILDPERRIARLRAEGRSERIAAIESRLGEVEREVRLRILRERRELLGEGAPIETYRRIGLDEALGLLLPGTAARAGPKTPATAGSKTPATAGSKTPATAGSKTPATAGSKTPLSAG
jgi:hypothetical protein